MESFNSLVAKQVSGTLRERLFQKEYLTEFLRGARAISHSHGSGEMSSFWGFCQEAVQDFLSIWSGESENFGTITVDYLDFLHRVGWNKLSSVHFSGSDVSDSLRPHKLQHDRRPCPSPTPGVHSNSNPLSRWCHPAISSSVVPFSSCPQSLPASESFPMS